MNVQADSVALTPGQQLLNARKASGKSLGEISRVTLIMESKLEAIERDDYGSVGSSPAFVVGYVKAYAKQVGVPEKPLIKVLESYFKQRNVAQANKRRNLESEKPKSRHWFPWLVTGIAIALFVGLGKW